MTMQTSIANALDNAAEEAMLDRNAKKIFSHEAVLAPLLRMCIPEFKGYSDEYILANCFADKPMISYYPVHQDEGGKLDGNQRVTMMNSESSAANERVMHVDIRFTVRLPGTGALVKMIINIEIQVDDHLRYRVVTRGIYYSSRMISEQYGTVFTHMDYQKIQKVYSIWICPDSASKQNSITEYRMQQIIHLGDLPAKEEDYDKLRVFVITLGPDGTNSEDKLIRYLSLLLSYKLPVEERKKRLEEEYRIEINEELRQEMSDVCNLGEGIARRSRAEGKAEGMAEGIAMGKAEGKAEGIAEGIAVGKAEGKAEGRAEGETILAKLMTILRDLGRIEEAFRAASDPEYRRSLYREFQLA